MATAGQALDKARSYLGLIEGPRDNETIFGAWTGANYQPWCHSFVSYVLDQVGAGIGKLTYCPAGVAYFRNKGKLFTTPEAGDLFFLYFPTMGRYAHVGFVERVDGDYVVTVEGNSNSSGSRTGGMVCRNRRLWRGTKMVFGRPAYSAKAVAAPAPPPAAERTAPDIDPPHNLPPIVDSLLAPNGGVWLLGIDGSIFGYGDAPYLGAANGKDYFVGREARELVAVDDKYRIIDATGAGYGPGF